MKTALEVSGGKDSLALVHLLRDQLAEMTVYWCNPGDADPNTLKAIEWIKERAPNFVEISGDIHAFRKQFGAASSIVPINSAFPIISDQICCMHNIMIPLQARVMADGNTRVIRGQKNADRHKGELRSGAVVDGVEYVYPLENWTDDDVIKYLIENDVPLPPVYRYSKHGIDCLHCSGWWEHAHDEYLKDCHPKAYSSVRIARRLIRMNVENELELC